MAGAIVGTPAVLDSGGSYTPETGSNRLVVFAFLGIANTGGRTVSSITLGGVAMEQAVFNSGPASGNMAYGAFYYIKEASIPSGSSALAITWSGAMVQDAKGVIFTLSGINQTTPTGASNSASIPASTNNWDPGSISAPSNSVLIYLAAAQSNLSFTIVSGLTGYTARRDTGASGWRIYCASKALAAGGTEQPIVSLVSTINTGGAAVLAAFAEAPTGPAITDVNTDEALSPGESITITGTGFGASQGAGGVAITQEAGAVSSAVTVTGWAADSITGTVALGGLSYGATTSLVVTDNAAATGSIAVTFVPAAGYSYVTLSGYPHATAYVVGEGASPALVDGDQVEYESVASSGAGVTVNADGSFVLDTTDPGHFQYRVRDDTDNTWSDWETIYVNEAAPSELVGAAPTRWWLQTPKKKRRYAGRLM